MRFLAPRGEKRADGLGRDDHEVAPPDDTGPMVTAYLISGPVVYAGIGWLLDSWLGTSFLLPVGLLAGMAMSLYIVWLRYGKP